MKFRRKSATEPGTPDQAATESAAGAEEQASRPAGPYDVSEMPELPEGVQRIDLGSLLISPVVGTELRLQVDEASGDVQAVLLTGPEGALELRAFAAPRHGDLWSEVRPQIAADMAQRGGVASEEEGRWGTELRCELTRTLADGRTGQQLSRIIGVNGNRWMLRATLIGGPARPGADRDKWDAVISTVAVRRGEGAMPVGEPLPLALPEGARRVEG
ncbi:DUF3710 domain-containing protein [uncultured Nocardioides sp.]|uniref:DUF3710 domain-containing protein n=1 Tax=uncultured Nocardioides sp. TaxID=198441 RepID=UPI000C6A5C30|nr:DUF3710 domain-containing protein [uncultured Nocardioides sp.]MAO80597.1 hypothetical protein [Nocardioides sp.]